MWFLPLLFVLGAGAVLSTSGCRRTPQPPVPDHLPTNPQNSTEVVPHQLNEFVRQDSESCEQFSRRFRTITVTNPTATLAALTSIFGQINTHARTQAGKVVYNYDTMRQDMELHSLLARTTSQGMPLIPDLNDLVGDGAPAAIDTPLDMENLVKMRGVLEDLLTTSSPAVASARNNPGFTIYLYSLKIYVRTSDLSPSYVVTNRSVRDRDLTVIEQIRNCPAEFVGVLTPPDRPNRQLIVWENRPSDAGGSR